MILALLRFRLPITSDGTYTCDAQGQPGHDSVAMLAATLTPMSLSTQPRHILNTPNRVSGIGALSAAENASASTRRVSLGAMMPSSHSRAVA